MERILFIKGKQKQRLTPKAYDNNKERLLADGWKEATIEEVLEHEGGELIEEKPTKKSSTKKSAKKKDAPEDGENKEIVTQQDAALD